MGSYDKTLLGYITIFENLTSARVKDCFFDRNENLVFVVNEGETGKAIGRNGSNTKRIGNLIKKKIRVIGYSKDVVKFVKNIVGHFDIEVSVNEKEIFINAKDSQTRAHLLGREKSGLKELNEIVRKYFDVKIEVLKKNKELLKLKI